MNRGADGGAPSAVDMVVREIVLSEESYLATLDKLVRLYVRPLRLESLGLNPLLKPAQVATLFSDIEAVLCISNKLLAELHRAFCEGGGRLTARAVGRVFCDAATLLKLYTAYVNSYPRALETHQTLLLEPGYKTFCERAQAEAGGQGFDSLLITPVQRVPRYSLLLKELLKQMPPGGAELEPGARAEVAAALDKVSHVAAVINDNLRDRERRAAVLRVQERFGSSAQLVAPGRWFVRQGVLRKVCKRRAKYFIFVLFNDALCYGSHVPALSGGAAEGRDKGPGGGGGGGSGRDKVSQVVPTPHGPCAGAGHGGASFKAPAAVAGSGSYRLHRIIDLCEAEAEAEACSPAGEPTLLVLSPLKSFKVIADTIADRDAWVSDLRNHITACKRARSTRAAPRNLEPQNAALRGSTLSATLSMSSLTAALGSRRASLSSLTASQNRVGRCGSYQALVSSDACLEHTAPLKGFEYAPVRLDGKEGAQQSSCGMCNAPFSMLRARHQCRRCGQAVCSTCSPNRWRLRSSKLERVCNSCYFCLAFPASDRVQAATAAAAAPAATAARIKGPPTAPAQAPAPAPALATLPAASPLPELQQQQSQLPLQLLPLRLRPPLPRPLGASSASALVGGNPEAGPAPATPGHVESSGASLPPPSPLYSPLPTEPHEWLSEPPTPYLGQDESHSNVSSKDSSFASVASSSLGELESAVLDVSAAPSDALSAGEASSDVEEHAAPVGNRTGSVADSDDDDDEEQHDGDGDGDEDEDDGFGGLALASCIPATRVAEDAAMPDGPPPPVPPRPAHVSFTPLPERARAPPRRRSFGGGRRLRAGGDDAAQAEAVEGFAGSFQDEDCEETSGGL